LKRAELNEAKKVFHVKLADVMVAERSVKTARDLVMKKEAEFKVVRLLGRKKKTLRAEV